MSASQLLILSIFLAHPRGRGVPPSGSPVQTENTDYPRPAGHGEEEAHPPPHNEEEVPKKKKHHGHGNHDDNRLLESAYRKAEASMPTRDHVGGKNGFGAGGRISQPAAKAFGV